MPDVLGTTASVIAVIQMTTTVVSLSYGYISSLRRAPEDLNNLVDELKSLTEVLTSLHICAQDPGSTVLQRLDGPLQQCLADMVKLQDKLNPKKDLGMFGKMRARFRWPFEENEISNYLLRIERLKSSFVLAMAIDQQSRTNTTLDRVHEIDTHVQGAGSHIQVIDAHIQTVNTHVQGVGTNMEGVRADITDLRTIQSLSMQEATMIRNDEQRTRILNWLYPEEVEVMHNRISCRRKKGTGEWILRAPEFKDWIEVKSPNHRLLWGYGIPGAGKTFLVYNHPSIFKKELCSRAIDHLQEMALRKAYGIAYIYFNFKDQERQQPVQVLASLVKQLACGIQHLPPKLIDLHAKSTHENKRPSFEDLYTSLLEIVNSGSFTQTFVICDALDECHPKFQRKELLPLFHQMSNDRISLFLTSREYPEDIQDSLGGSAKLKLWAKDDDIANYIEQKIEESPRAKRLIGKENCKDKIVSELTSCAKGMFLLVHFHIEHLCQQPTSTKILQELKRLRTSSYSTEGKPLDPTYDRVMSRIRAQSKNCKELAMNILLWVVKARRALNVKELQVAVSLDPGSDQTTLDEQDLPDVKTLLDVCASFVTIDDNNMVRLVHFTVQEYLLDNLIIPEHHAAELRLAMACTTYLSFDLFKTMDTSQVPRVRYYSHMVGFSYSSYRLRPLTQITETQSLEKHFISYAAEYFNSHITACRDSESLLTEPLLRFLGMPGNVLSYLQINYYAFTKYPSLRIAVNLGNAAVVRRLLETNNDMAPDSNGWTPLHIAVTLNRESVVQVLLDNGADTSITNKNGQAALHMVAYKRHKEIVQLLLEHRADASATDRNGETPLHIAAFQGSKTIVQLLLDHGADISITNMNGQAVLHIAADGRHKEIVQLLLRSGADTSATDINGETPLHIAAFRESEAIVQLLLEHGADTSITNKYGRATLHIAADRRQKKIVQLLLRCGADISVADRGGQTALHIAALRGPNTIVKLLLKKGAGISVRDYRGMTPLHIARYQGHQQMVRLLEDWKNPPEVVRILEKTELHAPLAETQ